MHSTTRTLGLTALAIALGSLAAEAAPPKGYTFSVIATLGDAAPGGSLSTVCPVTCYHVADFEPESINGRGDVAFASDLAPNFSSNPIIPGVNTGAPGDATGVFGEGLFARYMGTTRLIARPGDDIGETAMQFGAGIQTPAGMNDRGVVAFGFGVAQSNYSGVFRYDPHSNTVSPVLLPDLPTSNGMIFKGADFHTDLNNQGLVATTGIIATPNGVCNPTPNCDLGRGVYVFDGADNAAKIAAPGDPAPDATGKFDDAWDPNLNNGGDVIFGGHVTSDDACFALGPIGCSEIGLYLYHAGTRQLSSVAHHGQSAPGGDVFKLVFNGRLNASDDASFIGTFQCTGVGCTDVGGVFVRNHDGTLLKVARPGDALPGGEMENTTTQQGSHAIDNQGNVAFAARLKGGNTGVYLWSRGVITTVVATGTDIPGLGKVVNVDNGYSPGGANPQVHVNERGQILTQVIVDTGKNYLVVATPD